MALRQTHVAAAVAVLTTAIAVGGCGGGGAGTAAPPQSMPPANSPAAGAGATGGVQPSPSLPPGVARVISLGESTYGIAAAGDAVWVEGNGRILQLDAATGAQRRELPGFWPRVDAAGLWYLRDDELVEADALTGAERSTYSTPRLGTTVADGVLWAASEDDMTLSAIELETAKVLHATPLPDGEPKWVEPWAGAIWVVVDGPESGVVRVEPATGEIISIVKLPGKRPHSVAVAFGSLWVTDHGSRTLYRFGPDGTLEASIDGPGLDVAISATPDAIWAASPTGLVRVNPATNTVTGEIDLGAGEWYGLAFSAGHLWLTTGEAGRLLQIAVPGP